MIVVIFAGGEPPPSAAREHIPEDTFVIAADSGLDHAHSLGVAVDSVVGDMDSVDPDLLAALGPEVTVERHPVEKDATDLELALEAALGRAANEVLIVGGHGGRNDHLLANALLISDPRFAETRIRWLAGPDLIEVVHATTTVTGLPGETISLIPVADASGVRTSGLRWDLSGEELRTGTTRGVSNVLVSNHARINVDGGTLLVVRPGFLET